MSYRKHVVAATILRIFLVAGLFVVLAFSLLRVDSVTYAQTESAPTLTATPSADAVKLNWTEVSGCCALRSVDVVGRGHRLANR